MSEQILAQLKKVKSSISEVAYLSDGERNVMLEAAANALIRGQTDILYENELDIKIARAEGKTEAFIDRLMLSHDRIEKMKEGLLSLRDIKSPIGELVDAWSTEKGLKIKKVCVPLGVFCIVYEARPNVTCDTIGLAIKSGNGIVLRGSKDAINSNIAITKAMKSGIEKAGFKADFIELITDTTREGVNFLMKQRDYIDVIIPRGGKSLIKSTVENSLVPTIETGLGNCHVYINKYANLEQAKKIALSAKISRVSVCNSAESLLVDREIADKVLPDLLKILNENNVEVRGDEAVAKYGEFVKPICDEDYFEEYNDYIYSVKIVENVDEAISWINEHGTHHSDTIISENKADTAKFLERVDSACCFHNTTTRFSDGFEFGFGAEVGISTQKLHARGPMGIRELTTYKYKITSDYEIR